jgi:hypothetical protein
LSLRAGACEQESEPGWVRELREQKRLRRQGAMAQVSQTAGLLMRRARCLPATAPQ